MNQIVMNRLPAADALLAGPLLKRRALGNAAGFADPHLGFGIQRSKPAVKTDPEQESLALRKGSHALRFAQAV
ncbi:hypothetical protein D3C73_1527720 [compost metagenome]